MGDKNTPKSSDIIFKIFATLFVFGIILTFFQKLIEW